MQLFRRLHRALALGLVSLALVGCGADDPIELSVVAQEPGAVTDPDAELDCLGNPAADPADFPPAPETEIVRPDDKIIDLRGETRVEVPISDNVYDVRWFRVDPCTEIVFVNQGANPHNVYPVADGAFPKIEQDALEAGPQALVVAAPGDYPFFCSIHGTQSYRGQTGYLVVGDG